MKVRLAILGTVLVAIVFLYRAFQPPPAPVPGGPITAPAKATPAPSRPPQTSASPPLAIAAPAPANPPPSPPPAPMAPPPPVEPTPVAPLGTAQGLGGTPEEIASDLDRISLSLRDYRTVMVENPVGNNAEITSALMGENAKGARLAPPDARVDADGRMTDRWGTPYFFHQISATSMEIHSAGPDRKMGTEDDIVHR